MVSLLRKLLPPSVKSKIRQSINSTITQDVDARIKETVPALAANNVLASLYQPPVFQLTENGKYTWSQQTAPSSPRPSEFPFPPGELRMGQPLDDAEFLAEGTRTVDWIRRLALREGIDLERGASVLDWGCATGRVLRHFVKEAEQGEFWGVDQSGPAMMWAKQNLSPPFKFLTCTAFPHLPFEDNKFDLIYSLSVFTHMLHLIDMWVMELRRVMAPGGYAFFTIHDEHTWRHLAENDELRRYWITNKWWVDESFEQGLKNDMEFAGSHKDWNHVISFFQTAWIKREWGQYMEVVSIEPLCDKYQTTVVLRKPRT